MEKVILDRLTSLGHGQRLSLFRLLMRRYPDAVPAGELAAALGLKPSTLSAYVAALMQAGLITQHRVGTSLRYAIDMTALRQTFDYLLVECCRGRPDLCSASAFETAAGSAPMCDTKFKVLFICTGNSARSLFAETLLRDIGLDRFDVYSAGTAPKPEPNPIALALLRGRGHETAELRPKTIAELQGPDAPAFDFVFTVCDQAANEECPTWAGQPVSAHWGVPDPVRATGTDAQKSLAFHEAYGALKNRISAFAALPLNTLDRIARQQAVDDIGRTKSEEPA